MKRIETIEEARIIGDVLTGEFPFLFNDTYYIRYNSKKAIFALKKILNKKSIKKEEESSFYYHIYIDLLFEAVGQINDRFVEKKECSETMKKRLKRNREDYSFSEESYPLLFDKGFRNYIEHISSKNEKLINNNRFYGTFNFIHYEMKTKTIKELTDKNKPQNNLLNLIDRTYNIATMKESEIVFKSISLDGLKKELEKIYRISSKIWKNITKLTG